MRDISDSGARLHIGQQETVPDHFYLYVPIKEATYNVYVRWRQSEDVGVQFRVEGEEPSVPSAASGELSQRLERLESEVSELRRLVLAPHLRMP